MAGQRMDDHGSWIGSRPKHSVFPEGPYKVKHEMSAEGAGSVQSYADTTEAIKSQQEMGIRKAKRHSQKMGHRN